MIGTYPLLVLLHILGLTYWLGTDLGVYVASRMFIIRPDLDAAERGRFLKLAQLLDMGPRTCLVMMLPVGISLASAVGVIEISRALEIAAWLAGFVWLGLVWVAFLEEGRPRGVRLRSFDLVIRYVVMIMLAGAGLTSLGIGWPVHANWLAVKLIIFATIILCGIIVRTLVKRRLRAFEMLAAGETEVANRIIGHSYFWARRLVETIYVLLIAAAALGIAKPV